MNLKVLHVFNPANNAYNLVKGLHIKNVQADLIYSTNTDDQLADPSNEGSDKNEDWLIKWDGDSMHPFAKKKSLFNLIMKTRKYDFIHCHYPSSIFLQFVNKPFLIHETGWIRIALTRNNFVDKLMKRSYRKAKYIVMTNPDCYEILERIKHRNDYYVPFCLDTELYSYKKEPDCDLVFLHPNRLHWEYKGTDVLLRAFSKFVKNNPTTKLILIKYGKNLSETINLIHKLNLEHNIIWKELMNKAQLIKLYHSCHAVFDQFTLGSYGCVGVEAMSCGKPLVMYINEKWYEKCFSQICPTLQVNTEQEIYDAMNIIKDKSARKKLSDSSRNFAVKYHSLESVAERCIRLYSMVLK